MLKHEHAPDRHPAETEATARRILSQHCLRWQAASRSDFPAKGTMMPSTIETGTMDALLFAMDSRDTSAIRMAAHGALRAAFDHLFYDVEVPLTGDGLAMGTILVVANC